MKDYTAHELATQDEATQRKYFEKRARYNSSATDDARYSIRIGGQSHCLFAADTRELFAKYGQALRRLSEQQPTRS